jgi:hypothetical protein
MFKANSTPEVWRRGPLRYGAPAWIACMFVPGASHTREVLFANQLTGQLALTPHGRPGLHAPLDLQAYRDKRLPPLQPARKV